MKTFKYIVLFISIILTACAGDPQIDSTMLDSGDVYNLDAYPLYNLLSVRNPMPTNEEKNLPVIIAAHGYSATTFEWDELREFADSAQTFNVSQVLLGGHGRDYTAFKKATWKDWQSSIIEEYFKLDSLGYKNIYLVGSSTGAPLIINMIKSGLLKGHVIPKGIFLVDPIVVSSNKQLTMVSFLGPILGYSTTDLAEGEKGNWYVYRPQESLKQLMQLLDSTRIDLQKGIKLPGGTFMKTYKSKLDETADPVSAVMIYKGMRTYDGGKTEVEMIDSKLHVFTRLRGRDNLTAADSTLQMKTFKEMERRMVRGY